ncbi:MAG: hypothetical protein Q7P63_11045 [Verrucomicrobiota bacterium JB022]|nr:hypothetical protein [Verrucomicrobiota bacterium JB022]
MPTVDLKHTASMPYSLKDIDARRPAEVVAALQRLATRIFPGFDPHFIEEAVTSTQNIFEGRFGDFQAMDTVYHDLEHTLQATLCWARLFSAYVRNVHELTLTEHDLRVGLYGILLHDIGYLKRKGDGEGTGAKYTFVHERRSCEMAQIYLLGLGWSFDDIFSVQHLISCTGPRSLIDSIPFVSPTERLLGQMVCTADFLGQMSDPGYPDKLPVLFKEFEESDDFRQVPVDERAFRSADALMQNTPLFWADFVIPKLELDCGGVCHYLAEPYPNGRNPYLLAVEDNIERLRQRQLRHVG